MSRIRSKWTRPERTIHNYLKGMRIKHKMHPNMLGNPDVLLKGTNNVIFIQGCFWHGCERCYMCPKTDTDYWRMKIRKNMDRDAINETLLTGEGWNVINLWEHDITKNLDGCLSKILSPGA